ncbi:hypothetical protein TNIN_388331 [Trichonephila inaurata madagascariensis]|uniref:Uncharacterized protein n=1 Tax=Trichonephila inaurata madagascariensis TaxID=2747483 RepID=A0A8X6XEU3_9ARAC|nr:hypothetical protein TNIN_388331 [Trichonephila inaurata madagascariensis]
MNWQQTTRTYGNEEAVLRLVEDNTSLSNRLIAQQVVFFQSIVRMTLAANQMSAYHLHHVQLFQPEDYLIRRMFSTWFLLQSATDSAFAASVFFMDTAYFTREGTFENPL